MTKPIDNRNKVARKALRDRINEDYERWREQASPEELHKGKVLVEAELGRPFKLQQMIANAQERLEHEAHNNSSDEFTN